LGQLADREEPDGEEAAGGGKIILNREDKEDEK